MSWNYRVIREYHADQDEVSYGIHEVYYNESGKPVLSTVTPVPIRWSDDDDPLKIIEQMKKALEKPCLDPKDFQ